MTARKVLDGGGVTMWRVTGTRDEAQAYLDRDEPIPHGCYLIDRPLVIHEARLTSGHVWAGPGVTLIFTGESAVEVVP